MNYSLEWSASTNAKNRVEICRPDISFFYICCCQVIINAAWKTVSTATDNILPFCIVMRHIGLFVWVHYNACWHLLVDIWHNTYGTWNTGVLLYPSSYAPTANIILTCNRIKRNSPTVATSVHCFHLQLWNYLTEYQVGWHKTAAPCTQILIDFTREKCIT